MILRLKKLPVFIEGDVLKNSITAQGKQSILLKLVVIGIGFHGGERQVDDLLQHGGMDLRCQLPLCKIVKTRSGCHLNAELFRVGSHARNDELYNVDSRFVKVRSQPEQIVQAFLYIDRPVRVPSEGLENLRLCRCAAYLR